MKLTSLESMCEDEDAGLKQKNRCVAAFSQQEYVVTPVFVAM